MRRAPASVAPFFSLAFGLVLSVPVGVVWGGGGLPRAFGADAAAAETSGPKAKAPEGARARPPAGRKAKAPPGAAGASEVTLQGELTCAKCGLHESSTCQSVLVVKPGEPDQKGRTDGAQDVKYYLTRNAVVDAQHEKVCRGSVPVTITGQVTEEGGRKVLTASTVTPR